MIELREGAGTPGLRALLPTAGPLWRRAFAVLDGSAEGHILTDDSDAPTWLAVQELSDSGALALAGELDRGRVAGIVAMLAREHVVTVGLADGSPLLPVLPTPDREGMNIDFEERDPAVVLEPLAVPPPGLRLARIDAELEPRCAWSPWMCATPASALRDGIGYCLLDGERVVAEAFAGPPVNGALEMGMITDAAYRRRGLSTVVSAQTILACEARGQRTWWNTSIANVASAGLARKLGYRVERRYRVLAWNRSSAG